MSLISNQTKGGEFYNNPLKSWLQDNDIEMYSTHTEGKSVITSDLNDGEMFETFYEKELQNIND